MTRTASEWVEWPRPRSGWCRFDAGENDNDLDVTSVERAPGDTERWQAGVDSGESWVWIGTYPTADAAKAAADARLVELGWVLL